MFSRNKIGLAVADIQAMFSRPGIDYAVADIRALLGDSAPDTGQLDEARLAEVRQAVTTRDPAPGRRRTWRPGRPQLRRRLLISCLALPVLLGATAAGWALTATPPASRVADAVVCYVGPTAYRHGHFTAHGILLAKSSGASPVTVCSREYAKFRHLHPYVARHLVACSLPPNTNAETVSMGAAAVVPDTTCAAMHLPPLPAGWDQAARRAFGLEAALQRMNRRCRPVTAAVAGAQHILSQRGFVGWVVTTPWGTSSKIGTGCWEAQMDSGAHAVQVLPAP